MDNLKQKVYALNLFDVKDKTGYLNYVKQSAKILPKYGGRVISIGKFNKSIHGEIKPRTVLILVEWDSEECFDNYRNNPDLKELHPFRENSTENYIWHLFDKLEDFRILLK